MVPQLIVGLGNPGKEYESTRHNAGFFFVERLAQCWQTDFAFQPKWQAEVAKTKQNGRDVWLVKPTTFMNRSGMAVSAVTNFYKIPVESVLAVHDELDLLPGDIRLKVGGGAGGHNGLKDMIGALGSPAFMRLRLGIGHPGHRSQVSNYVLHPFAKSERLALDEAIDRALQVMPLMMEDHMPLAMNQLHSKQI